MESKELRLLTENRLNKELMNIKENYMKIYDRYYSKEQSRDDAFLKDLVDMLLGLSAILEVYTQGFKIHPGYALEKLNYMESYVKSTIAYYESKNEIYESEEVENGND